MIIRRIAVLDDYQRIASSIVSWDKVVPARPTFFHDPIPADRLAETLAPYEALALMRERTTIDAALLGKLPHLRLITTTAMSNAAIDLKAAAARGIVVSGTEPPANTSLATATLTWALILTLTRRIVENNASLRAGYWQDKLGTDLQGKTLGIVGLGRLGAQVAQIASGFGMRVIAWSENLAPARAAEVGVMAVNKVRLFSTADVITVHQRLSDRTHGSIGAAELALMKPTAFLVNTSRGPVIDENALIRVLQGRRIAGAALDVFDREPLPIDHPFRTLPNLLATPHIGYVTENNMRAGYAGMIENIQAAMAGRPIRLL